MPPHRQHARLDRTFQPAGLSTRNVEEPEFLLDYHADGQLSQATGVYPGALWGKFPPEPRR